MKLPNQVEQDLVDRLTEIPGMADLLKKMTGGMRGPEGELIEFKLKRDQHSYLYYEGPRGEMYCYTPWKSTLGWYYAYTMQPYGKGSQSGNATQWRARNVVRFRKRNLAKKTALHRLYKAKGD